MLKKYILRAFAVLLPVMALASCSGNSKSDEALQALASELTMSLNSTAAANPGLLESASAEYSDGTLAITAVLADTALQVKDIAPALMEYFTAMELKANPGKNLDILLNDLPKVKGSLAVTLKDIDGETATYEMPAARIRTLYTAKSSQLNFQEARANALQLLEKQTASLAQQWHAQSGTFEFSTSFATYTFTFGSRRDLGQLSQGNVLSRALKVFQPQFNNFGPYKSTVTDMYKDLGIEGIRVVYTVPQEEKPIFRAVIPWRDI